MAHLLIGVVFYILWFRKIRHRPVFRKPSSRRACHLQDWVCEAKNLHFFNFFQMRNGGGGMTAGGAW